MLECIAAGCGLAFGAQVVERRRAGIFERVIASGLGNLTRHSDERRAFWRVHMIQTLRKNWLLLALCGVLDATISVVYLVMQETDGPLTFHAWNRAVAILGLLTLAAGACTIAAGIWSKKGKCWLLVLNGLALMALALICYGFVSLRISFLTIALRIILMAISIGILELVIARNMRRQRHVADGWLLGLAGVASAVFALAFLAMGFRWIKIAPGSHLDLLWLGFYFGFSAICMLGLALRLHGQGISQPPLGSPRHAH